MHTEIITIVPRIFPSICGVGDYALRLATELRERHNISTVFIVCDPAWNGGDNVEGFAVKKLAVKSADSLVSLLSDKCPVLLHYVNYGYAKRGCPYWLLDGLNKWKSQSSSLRLTTMFHELYAFGPPWTSTFWLSPIHRALAAQFCRLSDGCITSMQKYADKLSGWDRSKAGCIPALPVFSSIGEPSQIPQLVNRKRRIIVFGGKAMRARAYTVSLAKLKAACSMLDIDEVVDVGPELGFSMTDIGVPFVTMGKLPSQEIQQIMLNSWAGYIDYFPGYLAKSGIFASYCAHGLVTVCAGYNPSEADGINTGEIYLDSNMDLTNLKTDHLQSISDNALVWYQRHNLAKQVEIFASVLRRT